MRNLYQQFRALLPDAPLQAGTVIEALDAEGGRVTVRLPGGGLVKARGQIGSVAVGQQVFVRDGVVEGAAPNLVVEVIEI